MREYKGLPTSAKLGDSLGGFEEKHNSLFGEEHTYESCMLTSLILGYEYAVERPIIDSEIEVLKKMIPDETEFTSGMLQLVLTGYKVDWTPHGQAFAFGWWIASKNVVASHLKTIEGVRV